MFRCAVVLALVILVLAGCQRQTGAAPTPSPLALDAIGPLLWQPGDLPAAFTPRNLTTTVPEAYGRSDIPAPHSLVKQGLNAPVDPARGAHTPDIDDGYIVVARYPSDRALQQAYDAMTQIDGRYPSADPVPNLGEQARISSPTTLGATSIAFVRCGVVGHVYFAVLSPVTQEQILAYARRVDARLKQALCTSSTATPLALDRPMLQ